MGREVRHVPEDWKHPRDEQGEFIPLYKHSFQKELDEWLKKAVKWEQGFIRSYGSNKPKWVAKTADHNKYTYEEWAGSKPKKEDYMPDWPEEERTHLMMYECTTEGTPISPAFEQPEELARWLADNNASAIGYTGATYEQWLAMIKQEYAPTMVFTSSKGLQSGVEASKE